MLGLTTKLTHEQLQPGDVLLAMGRGATAGTIAVLSQSMYSHAAIWTGQDVIEAIPGGVVRDPLSKSYDRRRWFHVYRWRPDLADRPSLSPVVEAAVQFVNRPYAMSDVLFMAFEIVRRGVLLSKRDWAELKPQLPELIAKARTAEQLGNRAGVTCSELVAGAYLNADREGLKYAQRLAGSETDFFRSGEEPAPAEALSDPELAELVAICTRLVAPYALAPTPALTSAEDPYRAAELIAGVDRGLLTVTPKDLARSPSLVPIGRLQAPDEDPVVQVAVPAAAPEASAAEPAPAAARVAPCPPIAAPPSSRLLYVAASPKTQVSLDTDNEFRALQQALEQSRFREQLALCTPALGARAYDIAQALDSKQPNLVHFAGHGGESGLVTLDRALGLPQLRVVLGRHVERLQVVVLNACDTAELAAGLAQDVAVAIGMRGPIRNSEATQFAQIFYGSLGNGRSVREAFELARDQLGERADLPLLAASRVDPALLFVAGVAAPAPVSMAAGTAAAPPKRGRWRLGAAAAALALAALLALGATEWGFAAREVGAGQAPLSPVALIAGGVLRPGSSEAEGRAAYALCRSLELAEADALCGAAFEGSVFAREVETGEAIAMPSFRIDRVEVDNAQFARWLDESRARLRLETDPDRLNELKLPGPAVLRDGEWIALVGLEGQPFDPALAIVHDGGRYRVLSGRDRQPVRMVSWLGARGYCVGHGLRLPSSPEWEWAARGAARRIFPWGDAPPRDCAAVVFGRRPGQPCEARRRAPEAVGTSNDVTPDGVYDLGGNVSEWVEDAFGPDDFKLVRGGHYQDAVPMLGAARRFRAHRAEVYRQLGFRCAQTVQ